MALSKADFNNINVTPVASKKLKFNSGADGFEAGDLGGSMVLLSTQTASGSANLTFDSSIDSTYKKYVFKIINIHPAASSEFYVNFRDGGSAYDATKTTTLFRAAHREDDASATLSYDAADDKAQSTGFQALTSSSQIGLDSDENVSGEMTLFDPSSTTFVKHFMSQTNYVSNDAVPNCLTSFTAGYCNVTAAIDGVQFKMGSGNIDSGIIKMYGIT